LNAALESDRYRQLKGVVVDADRKLTPWSIFCRRQHFKAASEIAFGEIFSVCIGARPFHFDQ
jgi:hypothetical protein